MRGASPSLSTLHSALCGVWPQRRHKRPHKGTTLGEALQVESICQTTIDFYITGPIINNDVHQKFEISPW